MGIITAFGLVMNMNAFRGFSFRNDRDTMVAALQKARSQAINNICLGTGCTDGKPHGVYFYKKDEPNRHELIIYQGSDFFSRNSAVDEVVNYEGKATYIANPANVDINFAQLSGDSASTTIFLADGTYRTADIQINSAGRIDY